MSITQLELDLLADMTILRAELPEHPNGSALRALRGLVKP
jgi:hypothetical protein